MYTATNTGNKCKKAKFVTFSTYFEHEAPFRGVPIRLTVTRTKRGEIQKMNPKKDLPISHTVENQSQLTRKQLSSLLLIISLASFATPMISSGVNIALPDISSDFSVSASNIGWVQTSFLLMSAVFLFPFGKMSDRTERGKIFLSGLLFQIIGFGVAGLSPSFQVLLIGMALAGFGSAQVLSVAIPLLTTSFPHQERGKILGINTAVTYTSLALGPFIGGILVANFGWPSLFFVLLPITTLVLCLAIRIIPKMQKNTESQNAKPFDGAGSILYISAASFVLIGISRISNGGYASIVLLIGITLSVLFLWWESKHPDPVFPISTFRENKIFRNSSLAALINYASSFAVALLLSFYLQNVQNFSSITTGTILVTQPLIMAVLTPFAGRLSDRIDPRILATIGMAMTAASLFAFSFLTSTTPLWVIIAILLILGSGFALFSSPNMNSIMSSVPNSQAGIASATAGTMRVFGQVTSMAAVMVVFATILGSVVISAEIAEALLEALSMTFLALGILCMFGIYFSYARGTQPPKEHT